MLNTTAKGISSSTIDTIKYNTQSQMENIRRLIALPYRIIFFSALLNHLIDTKTPHTIHVSPINAYIFLPTLPIKYNPFLLTHLLRQVYRLLSLVLIDIILIFGFLPKNNCQIFELRFPNYQIQAKVFNLHLQYIYNIRYIR